MIDEEAPAYLGSRVDVAPRAGVRPLAHDAGHEGHAHLEELVGHPVDRDGEQPWIGQNDLVQADTRHVGA